MHKYLQATLAVAAISISSVAVTRAQEMKPGTVGAGVPAFTVRSGYTVTAASPQLEQARFLEIDDKGTLYVSMPNKGKIVSMRDTNNDGVYDKITDFVTGKNSPHGMHWHNGWLWFGRNKGIERARDTNGDGKADDDETVVDGLDEGGHWWRSIFVTNDGFFTSIGDSGNASDQSNTDRQKIWFYSLDGKTKKLWSSGIRNTEKLLYRPGTTELYGADHGSDDFGKSFGESKGKQPITDNNPPCEFNHYVEGGFYGHPFVTALNIPRPEFKDRPDILELVSKTIKPEWNFGAHWAPNGWTFTTKPYFGQARDAFVAAHGSWNSTAKVGYRIERIMFDDVTGKPYGSQMMVSTLTPDGNNNLGRPTDCVEAPDGSLLWSCDQTNRVYRLSKAK